MKLWKTIKFLFDERPLWIYTSKTTSDESSDDPRLHVRNIEIVFFKLISIRASIYVGQHIDVRASLAIVFLARYEISLGMTQYIDFSKMKEPT